MPVFSYELWLSDIYSVEDVRMLVGFAQARDMTPLKNILACDPLPIYSISFRRFVFIIPKTPNSKRRQGWWRLDWMNGCSHGVTCQLLEVHGCAK